VPSYPFGWQVGQGLDALGLGVGVRLVCCGPVLGRRWSEVWMHLKEPQMGVEAECAKASSARA